MQTVATHARPKKIFGALGIFRGTMAALADDAGHVLYTARKGPRGNVQDQVGCLASIVQGPGGSQNVTKLYSCRA